MKVTVYDGKEVKAATAQCSLHIGPVIRMKRKMSVGVSFLVLFATGLQFMEYYHCIYGGSSCLS